MYADTAWVKTSPSTALNVALLGSLALDGQGRVRVISGNKRLAQRVGARGPSNERGDQRRRDKLAMHWVVPSIGQNVNAAGRAKPGSAGTPASATDRVPKAPAALRPTTRRVMPRSTSAVPRRPPSASWSMRLS